MKANDCNNWSTTKVDLLSFLLKQQGVVDGIGTHVLFEIIGGEATRVGDHQSIFKLFADELKEKYTGSNFSTFYTKKLKSFEHLNESAAAFGLTDNVFKVNMQSEKSSSSLSSTSSHSKGHSAEEVKSSPLISSSTIARWIFSSVAEVIKECKVIENDTPRMVAGQALL